jgi:hypothetical protein
MLMWWLLLIIKYILALILVGNILYVVLFQLIRFLEWLLFAFKITYNNHNQFKWRKHSINIKDYFKPSIIGRVNKTGWVFEIKNYIRSPYDSQYEERIKQPIPRLFKIIDRIITAIHTRIIARLKRHFNQKGTIPYFFHIDKSHDSIR